MASVVAMDVPLRRCAELRHRGGAIRTAALSPSRKSPSPAEAKSTLASTGIYIFEPAVLDLVPSGSRLRHRSPAVPANWSEKGCRFMRRTGLFNWIDIGRVSGLLVGAAAGVARRGGRNGHAGQGNQARHLGRAEYLHSVGIRSRLTGRCISVPACASSPACSIIGPAWIGHGSHLRNGAKVTRSVLFEYTRIGAGMHFNEMIVSPQLLRGPPWRYAVPG